uniref:Transmembrane protein n=1 Tax=Grammatophora oceanica TaxID=210454 RepID=A0A7S1UYU5_9STRA|mmetsp:Transcript_29886/g.44141  ORF Transcript_29886/g.44141 Transcript_29886/m.44141 type:complete len:291 (+) Transcript_29886:69-941(+)
MKRIFGRGDRLDEPLDGRNVSPGRKRLLLAFHLSALATIVLPWIFFGMMRSMRGEAASGDDENQQNNWWNNGDDNADNGEGDQDQDQQQDEAEENNDENQDEQDDGQDQEDDGDQDENDNNNNERRLGWWWNRDNYDEEAEYERDQAQRLIVLTFIYVWSFLVFIILLCYASVALTRQGMAVSLFTALVMFANLALMCCVLVETSGLLWRDDEEARERYGEEGGWWGTLAGGLVGPTFFLWFLWSTVMAMMVYCIVMKRRRNSSNDKVSKIGSRDDGSWYRRQDDTGVFS